MVGNCTCWTDYRLHGKPMHPQCRTREKLIGSPTTKYIDLPKRNLRCKLGFHDYKEESDGWHRCQRPFCDMINLGVGETHDSM